MKRNLSHRSVITDHRIQYSHNFDWDRVRVLDNERSYHKRLISETLHIKSQSHGLNLHSDTENLDSSYLPLSLSLLQITLFKLCIIAVDCGFDSSIFKLASTVRPSQLRSCYYKDMID